MLPASSRLAAKWQITSSAMEQNVHEKNIRKHLVHTASLTYIQQQLDDARWIDPKDASITAARCTAHNTYIKQIT
jgi:hypothetical protein